jgi:hypothetical protein
MFAIDFSQCKPQQKDFPLAQFFSGLSGESLVSRLEHLSASLSGRPWRVCFMFRRSKGRRLFCHCDCNNRDDSRHARRNSCDTLLAWNTQDLAVHWAAHRLCINVCHAAAGFGIWYAAQPHVLNLNGPTPVLDFEVKPPEGQSAESLADVESELDTDRNSMPGTWRTEAPENPAVRAGNVDLYFRTSKRPFVLKFPGYEDRIFNLHLPASPMKAKYRTWSEWQKPDFVAKAAQQPIRFSGGNEYQIRYKLNYLDR